MAYKAMLEGAGPVDTHQLAALLHGQPAVHPSERSRIRVRAAMLDNRQGHIMICGMAPEVVLLHTGAEPVIFGRRMMQVLQARGVLVQPSRW